MSNFNDAQDPEMLTACHARSGLTTAKQQPEFRATHLITVKTFDHTHKAPISLPSNKNSKHTYGMPSSHRAAEVVRQCGPVEPQMKHLVQGAYQVSCKLRTSAS